MPKKDIIRCRDHVRIIRPYRFVRCGYPLCLPDIAAEIRESHKEEIDNLIQGCLPNRKPLSRGFIPFAIDPDPLDKIREDVAYAIAKGVIVAKRFGGNKRQVYEKEEQELMGLTAHVGWIRYVQSGTREEGGHYSSYFGEEDYDPPYLSIDKVHKVLSLDTEAGVVDILAENCEKMRVEEASSREWVDNSR